MATVQEERETLQRELDRRLLAANKNARRFRTQNTVLLVTALVFGLLATVLAGDAYAGGNVVAAQTVEATTGSAPSELARGWRNLCGLIALFTFLGTAATGLNSVLKIAEHQSRAFVCAGILDGLHADLIAPSSARRETLDRVRTDLAKLLRDYPEYFR